MREDEKKRMTETEGKPVRECRRNDFDRTIKVGEESVQDNGGHPVTGW